MQWNSQTTNERIKQLAVRTETLVQKAYSIKKRASHPSSIRDSNLDFRKLVEKLEQAEITMKLVETENLKLQYVNRNQTNTTQINNIHDSDVDLTKKFTEILNIYVKIPIFKGKPSFKNWCNHCQRYGHIIAECIQKQQDKQNKPQKYKEPNKLFYQYLKKDQNLPNKLYIVITALVNHSHIIQITQEINLPITLVIEVDHHNKKFTKFLTKLI